MEENSIGAPPKRTIIKKVTSINNQEVTNLDVTNTVPIFQFTTVVPVVGVHGKHPLLAKALVDKMEGVSIGVDKIVGNGIEKSKTTYGSLTEVVIPKRVYINNPIIKIKPLVVELLSYIPFMEDGKKFIMVTLIEQGRAREELTKTPVDERPMVLRYVYQTNDVTLKYHPSYMEALEYGEKKSLSNYIINKEEM